MVLINKFLSPICAPAHGDIATYFFFEKTFRSDGEMCVSVTSSQKKKPVKKIAPKMASLKHTFLHRIEIFFRPPHT